jgi:hypothetical protein
VPLESSLVSPTLLETLKRFGVKFEGWYAESAEGVVTRYEEPADPEHDEDVEEIAARAA